MKHLHFGIKSGKPGTAPQHIAYIMREGFYSHRGDLIATGHGNMPRWAEDSPKDLWIASDKYERKNGSRYRAFTISLPNVLTIDQLIEAAWKQARLLAGPKPFQFAVHLSTSSLDGQLNPHVHIVICDRVPDEFERTPEQMFRRYNPADPAKGGCRKDSGGMNRLELRDQLLDQRDGIFKIANAMLEKHGHAGRVDHRRLDHQGSTRKAERYLGPARIRTMTPEEKSRHVAARKGER